MVENQKVAALIAQCLYKIRLPSTFKFTLYELNNYEDHSVIWQTL